MHDYVGVPEAALKYGSGPEPVESSAYRVSADDFPRYRVASTLFPPKSAVIVRGELHPLDRPFAPILPTDIWEVRYKFKEYLLVNSLEFDRRDCREGIRHGAPPTINANGTCTFDWCLYISISGEVTGGWDHCVPGGKKIFRPDPELVQKQDWGPQPFFEVIPRTSPQTR